MSNDDIRERLRRVEKIEVNVEDPIESRKLLMNKHLSSPFHCAKHISSVLVDRSCLALVDDQYYWDMNRPLERDCSLKFLHFLEEKCDEQNRAYWRTCSFIIGYLLETSFKPNFHVELCSFPPPDFANGSITYDAKLHLGTRLLRLSSVARTSPSIVSSRRLAADSRRSALFVSTSVQVARA
jgi:large subunit ribosomal protein L39